MGGHPSHSKANPNFDPNWKQTQPPHNGPITEGKTIIARFNACVEYFKDDTLLQYQENIPGNGPWKSVSYKEYQTICVQLAAAMEDIGMLPGDRIIMLGDGTGVWSLVAVAIQMVGASIIGVHSGFTPANTAVIVDVVKPKFIFGCETLLNPVRNLIEEHDKKKKQQNASGTPAIVAQPSKADDKGKSEAGTIAPNPTLVDASAVDASATSASASASKDDKGKSEKSQDGPLRPSAPTPYLTSSSAPLKATSDHPILVTLDNATPNDLHTEDVVLKAVFEGTTSESSIHPSYLLTVLCWTDLLRRGVKLNKTLQEVWNIRQPDDEASIFFTSGTTGFPKGVIHTQKSIVASCDQFAGGYYLPDRGRALILHFPASQLFQTALLSFMCSGVSVAIHPEIDRSLIFKIGANWLFSNPFSLNQGHKTISSSINDLGRVNRHHAKSALRHFHDHTNRELANGVFTEIPHKWNTIDKKVLKSIKQQMGPHLKGIWVSMAKSDPQVNHFFWSLGVHIYDAYGSTEMDIVCGNTNHGIQLNSIGKPMKGVDMKLDPETGELLVKAESCFKGYFVVVPDPNKPDPTGDAFTKDGYYKTGDVGLINSDGFIQIIDRMSHRIKLSSCQLLSPQKVENVLLKADLISQIAIFGDEQEYLVAVIHPAFEVAKHHGYHEKDFVDLIEEEIRRMATKGGGNDSLMDFEIPKKFVLIRNPFTRENGMLNVGDKMVRSEIMKAYKEDIVTLYTPQVTSHWTRNSGPTHDEQKHAKKLNVPQLLTALSMLELEELQDVQVEIDQLVKQKLEAKKAVSAPAQPPIQSSDPTKVSHSSK